MDQLESEASCMTDHDESVVTTEFADVSSIINVVIEKLRHDI